MTEPAAVAVRAKREDAAIACEQQAVAATRSHRAEPHTNERGRGHGGREQPQRLVLPEQVGHVRWVGLPAGGVYAPGVETATLADRQRVAAPCSYGPHPDHRDIRGDDSQRGGPTGVINAAREALALLVAVAEAAIVAAPPRHHLAALTQRQGVLRPAGERAHAQLRLKPQQQAARGHLHVEDRRPVAEQTHSVTEAIVRLILIAVAPRQQAAVGLGDCKVAKASGTATFEPFGQQRAPLQPEQPLHLGYSSWRRADVGRRTEPQRLLHRRWVRAEHACDPVHAAELVHRQQCQDGGG